jgi:hypothetical protein
MKASNNAVVVPSRDPRGAKKGIPNSGQFKRGYDPRRNLDGWSNMHKARSIEAEFQQHTARAVKALTDVMNDAKATPANRIAAAREILDRGYGKSVDRMAVASLTGAESNKPMEELSNEELLAIIHREKQSQDVVSSAEILSIVKDDD